MEAASVSGIRVVFAPNPLTDEREEFNLPAKGNVRDLVDGLCEEKGDANKTTGVWLTLGDGKTQFLDSEDWDDCWLEDGDELVVHQRPTEIISLLSLIGAGIGAGIGGGAGAGAGIGAAVAIGSVGGLLGATTGAAFAGALAGALVGALVGVAVIAGISIGLQFAITALTAPSKPKGQGSPSQSPSLTTATNDVRPYQKVPIIRGTWPRFIPPKAAQEYTVYEGQDQYLIAMYDFGIGPVEIDGETDYLGPPKSDTTILVDETPISEFTGVTVEIKSGGSGDTPRTLYEDTVVTDATHVVLLQGRDDLPGSDPDDPVPIGEDNDFVRTTANAITCDRIQVDFDFPQGLIGWDPSGDWYFNWVRFTIRMRDNSGPGSWVYVHPENNVGNEFMLHGWLDVGAVVGSVIRSTKPRFWNRVIFKPNTAIGSNDILIAARRSNSQAFGFVWDVADYIVGGSGKYDVEVSVSERGAGDDVTSYYRMEWTSLKTISFQEPVTRPGFASLTVKMRADDQLQGQITNLSASASGMIETWNGSTFDGPEVSDSGAMIALDGLRNPEVNAQAVEDARIDLDAFLDVETWHDSQSPTFTFNGIFDSGGSVEDALNDIGAVGRFAVTNRDGIYTAFMDRNPYQHSEPEAGIISPRNRVKGSYVWAKDFVEKPHALVLNFRDADAGMARNQVRVYNNVPGTETLYNEGTASIFEEVDAFGLTDYQRVTRYGRFLARTAQLRPELHTWKMDFEGIRYHRGDFVKFMDPVIGVGLGFGRIASHNTSSGDTSLIDSDQDIPRTFGKAQGVRIRRNQDDQLIAQVPTEAYVYASGTVGPGSTDLVLQMDDVPSSIQAGDQVHITSGAAIASYATVESYTGAGGAGTVTLTAETQLDTVPADGDTVEYGSAATDQGVITGLSGTLLTDSAKTWVSGAWNQGATRGQFSVVVTSGAALGTRRRIVLNTGTQLQIDSALPGTVEVGVDTYQIEPHPRRLWFYDVAVSSDIEDKQLFLFGELNLESIDLRITSVKPDARLNVALSAVDLGVFPDGTSLFDTETETIPAFDSQITTQIVNVQDARPPDPFFNLAQLSPVANSDRTSNLQLFNASLDIRQGDRNGTRSGVTAYYEIQWADSRIGPDGGSGVWRALGDFPAVSGRISVPNIEIVPTTPQEPLLEFTYPPLLSEEQCTDPAGAPSKTSRFYVAASTWANDEFNGSAGRHTISIVDGTDVLDWAYIGDTGNDAYGSYVEISVNGVTGLGVWQVTPDSTSVCQIGRAAFGVLLMDDTDMTLAQATVLNGSDPYYMSVPFRGQLIDEGLTVETSAGDATVIFQIDRRLRTNQWNGYNVTFLPTETYGIGTSIPTERQYRPAAINGTLGQENDDNESNSYISIESQGLSSDIEDDWHYQIRSEPPSRYVGQCTDAGNSGSARYLEDDDADWPVNGLIGMEVVPTRTSASVSGVYPDRWGQAYRHTVTSNTATRIEMSLPANSAPYGAFAFAADDNYLIQKRSTPYGLGASMEITSATHSGSVAGQDFYFVLFDQLTNSPAIPWSALVQIIDDATDYTPSLSFRARAKSPNKRSASRWVYYRNAPASVNDVAKVSNFRVTQGGIAATSGGPETYLDFEWDRPDVPVVGYTVSYTVDDGEKVVVHGIRPSATSWRLLPAQTGDYVVRIQSQGVGGQLSVAVTHSFTFDEDSEFYPNVTVENLRLEEESTPTASGSWPATSTPESFIFVWETSDESYQDFKIRIYNPAGGGTLRDSTSHPSMDGRTEKFFVYTAAMNAEDTSGAPLGEIGIEVQVRDHLGILSTAEAYEAFNDFPPEVSASATVDADGNTKFVNITVSPTVGTMDEDLSGWVVWGLEKGTDLLDSELVPGNIIARSEMTRAMGNKPIRLIAQDSEAGGFPAAGSWEYRIAFLDRYRWKRIDDAGAITPGTDMNVSDSFTVDLS